MSCLHENWPAYFYYKWLISFCEGGKLSSNVSLHVHCMFCNASMQCCFDPCEAIFWSVREPLCLFLLQIRGLVFMWVKIIFKCVNENYLMFLK